LQTQIDALKDAQANSADTKDDLIKLYGFMTMGVQRIFVKKSSLAAMFSAGANATDFVIGNLNTYLDVQPSREWRGLLEVRFTNAPNGDVSFVGGQYTRASSVFNDPSAASPVSSILGGYTVIERAQIDWKPSDVFNLRIGYFFTPFGIWNEDHGDPTLIGVSLPLFMSYDQAFPTQQTGMEAFGNLFFSGWQFGYAATVSNGRQDLSNWAFSDNRGFGGRLFLAREQDKYNLKLGTSFFTDYVEDPTVNISVSSSGIPQGTTSNLWKYQEWVWGIDASVDIGKTRIRAEGLVHRVVWDPNAREVNLFPNGTVAPNMWAYYGYVIVAHRIGMFEPFLYFEASHAPSTVGDLRLIPSVGVDIHLTTSVQWKNQFAYAMFLDTDHNYPGYDVPANNTFAVYSRLVLAY
jgi:hypothetical protein